MAINTHSPDALRGTDNHSFSDYHQDTKFDLGKIDGREVAIIAADLRSLDKICESFKSPFELFSKDELNKTFKQCRNDDPDDPRIWVIDSDGKNNAASIGTYVVQCDRDNCKKKAHPASLLSKKTNQFKEQAADDVKKGSEMKPAPKEGEEKPEQGRVDKKCPGAPLCDAKATGHSSQYFVFANVTSSDKLDLKDLQPDKPKPPGAEPEGGGGGGH